MWLSDGWVESGNWEIINELPYKKQTQNIHLFLQSPIQLIVTCSWCMFQCLQRDIQHNIEQEISKKASAVEPKSFTIFKPVDSGRSVNKKKLNK